jgi:hypothetical protein
MSIPYEESFEFCYVCYYYYSFLVSLFPLFGVIVIFFNAKFLHQSEESKQCHLENKEEKTSRSKGHQRNNNSCCHKPLSAWSLSFLKKEIIEKMQCTLRADLHPDNKRITREKRYRSIEGSLSRLHIGMTTILCFVSAYSIDF